MRKFFFLIAGGLATFALFYLIYAPALHGSFLWDDLAHIPPVRPGFYSVAGLGHIWTLPGFTQQYYPLAFTTVWVAHHLWGMNPFGYHLVNLVYHVLNIGLLWFVLSALGLPAAGWAALFWGLHPVSAESVAWISEIKNTQSAFFYLLALCFFLRFLRNERRSLYVAAFICFGAALATKTVSCTWPAVVLILLWYQRGRITAKDAWRLAPFFLVGLVVGLGTARWEETLIGARGPAWDYSLGERVRIAGHAFWFYFGKLAWPHPLLFIYPRWPIHRFHATDFAYVAAVPLALALLAWGLRRWGRGPLAATLVFAAVIAPALGFVNVYPMRYSFVADHFQYVASMALIALAVGVVYTVAGKTRLTRGAWPVAATLLCVVLTGLSWRRAHAFSDSETLWRDTLAKDPSSVIAHINLANDLLERGVVAESRQEIQQAARLAPEDVNVQLSLGHLLMHFDHDPAAAIEPFRRALETIERLPASHAKDAMEVFGHELLGEAYFGAGRDAEAKAQYAAALQALGPMRRQPFYDVTPEVIAKFEPDIRDHLAQLLEKEGNTAGAIEQLQAGLRLAPGQAVLEQHLGNSFEKAKEPLKAAAAYQQAVASNPRAWQAYEALGDLLNRQGRTKDAVASYERAADLNPDRPVLHARLAQLLLKLNRKTEAALEFEAAARDSR